MLWDGSQKHFGLRVSRGGAKSFIVLLGSGRRQTIGRFPTITLAEARSKAKRILAERTLGRHQASHVSWQAAVQKFIETCEAKNRARTHTEYARILRSYFPFSATRLSEITKQDIARNLEKLNSIPSQKGHALTVCKIFFRWALTQGFVELDPSAGFKRLRQKKATRILDTDELRKVWAAATEQGHPHGTLVQLLILTGQRRGEIANLRWSWINQKERLIVLPGWAVKNGKDHTFPYGEFVASILEGIPRSGTTDLLFPARVSQERPISGFSKYKQEMNDDVERWTLHSLRRLYRTTHAKIGTPPHIAERLINHASAVASDVEIIYDVWTYMPEMRAAIALWEERLALLLAPHAPANLPTHNAP